MVNSNINSNVNGTKQFIKLKQFRMVQIIYQEAQITVLLIIIQGFPNSSSKGMKNTFNTFSNVTSFFGSKKNNSKGNGSSNNTNKGTSNGNGTNSNSNNSSTIFIIVAVVLLIIVLGVAGYFVHRYMKQKNPSELSTKQFIPYIHDASIDKRISNGSIPTSSDGNEYNLNFWIYVNDYTVNKDVDKLSCGETHREH